MKIHIKVIPITMIICIVFLMTVAISGCRNAAYKKTFNSTEEFSVETFDASLCTVSSIQITTGSNTEYETTQKNIANTEKATDIYETTIIEQATQKHVDTTEHIVTTDPVMTAPDYTPEQEVIDIYNAINDYREEKGLHRLVLDKELCKLAYIRAQEQGQIKGHTRPNGKPFYSIVDEYGYERYGCGENIVIGPDADCKETVDCWKNSPGHNENMLKSKWIKTGMALCILDSGRYAIVQLFSY